MGEGRKDQGNEQLNLLLKQLTCLFIGCQLCIQLKLCRCDQFKEQNVIYSITARGFKAGKENVTTSSPGLFGCKKIYFQTPFYGGQQVTVLASVGHSVKRQTHGNGAAVWVEDVKASEFTVCILEYFSGSNNSLEVNYLAFEASPNGSQTGTTSLNSWTTGTECKRIDFQQVRLNSCLKYYRKQRDI